MNLVYESKRNAYSISVELHQKKKEKKKKKEKRKKGKKKKKTNEKRKKKGKRKEKRKKKEKKMDLSQRFDVSGISLYAKCARALDTVRVENRAAYDAAFGNPAAVAAARKMHAMRYASPDDNAPAMAYGSEAVVSVVACLFDKTSLTAGDRPRLIDSEVIKAVEELEPIVTGAKTHLAAR